MSPPPKKKAPATKKPGAPKAPAKKSPARKAAPKKVARKKPAPQGPGVDELKFMIDSAWERRTMLTPNEIEGSTRPLIERAIDGLESGEFRVIEARAEDIPLTRPANRPGPRCATHDRERKKMLSTQRWEQHIFNTYTLTEPFFTYPKYNYILMFDTFRDKIVL